MSCSGLARNIYQFKRSIPVVIVGVAVSCIRSKGQDDRPTAFARACLRPPHFSLTALFQSGKKRIANPLGPRASTIMSKEAPLSVAERDFILDALHQNVRLDGRGLDQFRPLSVSFGNEYGHVRLRLGKTR